MILNLPECEQNRKKFPSLCQTNNKILIYFCYCLFCFCLFCVIATNNELSQFHKSSKDVPVPTQNSFQSKSLENSISKFYVERVGVLFLSLISSQTSHSVSICKSSARGAGSNLAQRIWLKVISGFWQQQHNPNTIWF